MSDITSQVPAAWAAAARPFLQRADEFQGREPIVSYYLRTHVAYLCMQKRSKEDKEGTKFLMALLETLEKDKKALGSELEGTDGRTVLTRFGLMLFAKADDEERAGNANLGIVRLFFASSVLFEATRQFTDDGEMDRIAAEKCKYAKYIAAKMKKALDAGETYVSPNTTEKMVPEAGGGQSGEEVVITAPISTAPPSSYMPRPVPPPLPPAELRDASEPQPPTTVSGSLPSLGRGGPTGGMNQALPNYPPPPASTMSNHRPANNTTTTTTTAMAPPTYVAPAQTRPSPAVAPPVATYTSPAQTGFKPSVDEMIDAQKYARQAISALQFYDHANARQQLTAALRILDGTSKS